MSSLGKGIRLRRLLNRSSGRMIDITLDHAIARGVLTGMEDIDRALSAVVLGHPEAVTIHKGIAERCFGRHAGDTALILKCSSFSPYHKTYDAWVTEVDEAVRLGADAVAMGVIVGDERQPEALRNLGQFVRQAERAGLPVVTHIYPRGGMISPEDQKGMTAVRYAARVGAELGADIVKTTYTGSAESFHEVVRACPALVVAAGGVEAADELEFLQRTADVIAAGAAGLAYGRLVWGNPNPAAMLQALKMIVHEGSTPQAALAALKALAPEADVLPVGG